jgi:hypothetical protein
LLTTLATGGLSTAITYTCSGLPANTSCIVTPTSFTPTPSGSPAIYSATGAVQIDTAGPGILHTQNKPRGGFMGRQNAVSLAGLLGLPACTLLGFLARKRRKIRGALGLQVLLLIVFGLALSQTTGCGGSVSNPTQAVYTPVGASPITVTATTGTITQSVSFTLNVIAAP